MGEMIFKILLVEDDELDQMAFKRMVEHEKLSYDCTIAGSLSEAQQILNGKEFDVIISDYSLGDGTALDVLGLAKDTPVILVTGADDRETAVKAWRAGAYDYLTKDADREYLKTIRITIENAVRQHDMGKALERKRRNQNAIFDAVPICMLLINDNMMVLRVNRALKEMVGKEYLEIINRLPGNALGCINSIDNERMECGCGLGCDTCLLRKTIKEVLASGKTIHGIEIPLTLIIGGRQTTVWFSVSAEMVNIDDKKCVVTTLDDITLRKQAEEEIQHLSSFPRLNPDPILEINGAGNITFCNSAASEVLVKLGHESNPCVLLPSDMDNILKELKQGREQQIRREVKINGATFEEVIHFVREFNSIRIYASDVTERKRTEGKLKETMELKSQFISTVSHELRTPLTCIKEAVGVVLDGIAGEINDRQRHFLNIVKRNIERLTILINDVLDFQRLESGRSKIDIRENDVREVVRSIDETMSFAAKQKGLNFMIELDENLPRVWFDSNKIIQVLTNLIGNAIKFTPQGGSVTVSILRHGNELIMRVLDTGMGIPKEDLPKIFDKFYRVSRPGKEIQGTGLGLSIMQKIVDLHRGRIEVESEVNRGTTFTVFLPLDARSPREVLPQRDDETIETSLAGDSTKNS